MTRTNVDKSVLGGTIMPRRTAAFMVILALVPPVAWITSLASSYAIDDFVCSAAESAGVPGPSTGVITAVIVVNAVLFAATVFAGIVAYRMGRARRQDHPAIGFLGITTLPSAIVFGHGIAFIAVAGAAIGGCT